MMNGVRFGANVSLRRIDSPNHSEEKHYRLASGMQLGKLAAEHPGVQDLAHDSIDIRLLDHKKEIGVAQVTIPAHKDQSTGQEFPEETFPGFLMNLGEQIRLVTGLDFALKYKKLHQAMGQVEAGEVKGNPELRDQIRTLMLP
jgi:hypothetical protein